MASAIDAVLLGCRVEALTGGYRLVVRLGGGIEVVVANDFRLNGEGEVEHFYPGLGMQPGGGLPGLVGSRVVEVRVTPAGGLVLGFDCGRTLAVAPDTSPGGPAEAWRVTGADGPLFTALPGGYLAC